MFRALCAHHQEAKLYYAASGIVTPVGGRPVHRLGEDSTANKTKQNASNLSFVCVRKIYIPRRFYQVVFFYYRFFRTVLRDSCKLLP